MSRLVLLSVMAMVAASPSTLEAALGPPQVPEAVDIQPQGHGWRLTTADGMTLYVYGRDVEPGVSNCIEDCAVTWPPYVAAPDATGDADWSIINRPDGIRQWAFQTKPLYTYSLDQGPGDTYGEGSGAVWDLAFVEINTPPGIDIEATKLGYVLTDVRRMTLYSPADASQETCVTEGCGVDWKPQVASWAANGFGDWSVVERQDGIRQWAYKGRPLFQYAGDIAPRETNGHGEAIEAAATNWEALVLQPRPKRPDWVKVHATDGGEMLANSDNKTLYTFDPSKLRMAYRIAKYDCEIDCFEDEWVPVWASSDDVAPGGKWAIFDLSDGRRIWAFNGKKLFTNVRDQTDGSFLGYRHGGNRAWNVIMDDGSGLQGTLRSP